MIPSRILLELQQGISTLMVHKLRSFLTMLGVVFGVASVIAMLAVGEGANKDVLDQISKLGSRNIMIDSMKPVDEETSGKVRVRMSIYGLKYVDRDRILESFEHIDRVVSVKTIRNEGQLESRTLDIRILGVTPGWFDLVNRPLIAGRVLSQHDNETKSRVVVLTEYGARRLMATEQAIGGTIRIGGIIFEVAGIVQSESMQSGGVQTPDQNIDAYIPIDVAQNRFGDVYTKRTAGSFLREKVELHQIIVEVDMTENVEKTAAGIEHLLDTFHDSNDYKIQVPLALLRQAERTKQIFNIVLGSIAGISLLVGGIGIMNIMLASVTERTREIGIRRAIGAKRKQIVRQFLIETIVLSFAGGLIGIFVGMLFPFIITIISDLPTIVTIQSLILSVGISVGIGIVFGLYPAFRAARLDPIVALRHE